ncbi:MAG: crossover junction endodeoxyribonuclease RuvC [Bacteroidales bacterium]|nr:crossover junction endodeoxyribonuclease RuvC [Bacteroidales bacterium]MDD4656769.1 crossover junction endodeoxyribonuclease RuvC [Bacteroidales bacterium]
MISERVILGIDPGTQVFGWGVISIIEGRATYVAMGINSLRGEPDHFTRLGRIFKEVETLIKTYNPTELSIEAPFYGKNIQSMLKLGRAQGAAIAAALYAGMPIYEYAPRKIKQSITGKGAASKEQVALILSKILSVNELPESYDATDGLAAALCHFLTSSVPSTLKGAKKSSSSRGSGAKWDAFVKNNPNRIR